MGSSTSTERERSLLPHESQNLVITRPSHYYPQNLLKFFRILLYLTKIFLPRTRLFNRIREKLKLPLQLLASTYLASLLNLLYILDSLQRNKHPKYFVYFSVLKNLMFLLRRKIKPPTMNGMEILVALGPSRLYQGNRFYHSPMALTHSYSSEVLLFCITFWFKIHHIFILCIICGQMMTRICIEII